MIRRRSNSACTKRMDEYSRDELTWIVAKARLPEKLVLDIAAETAARFGAAWNAEKKNLPLAKSIVETIDAHVKKIPIAAA